MRISKWLLGMSAVFVLVFLFACSGGGSGGNSGENNNKNIVGTWYFYENDIEIELVFNTNPNTGHMAFSGSNYNGTPDYFTWEKKGNLIFIVYDEEIQQDENTSFEYNGGNTLSLPCLDVDCPPFVFTKNEKL